MNTSGLKAGDGQNAKELDSMKESISDIINQLQDIDPARLSFSPFLDLDTQICMAPVSDSPESSVEELHSSSHSASGSQRSLEPLPSADEPKNSASSHQQPSNGLHEEKRRHGHTEEGALNQTLSTPITTERNLAGATENCIKAPTLMSQGDIPNGTNTPKWSPESPCLSCTGDEDRPLMAPPPDSVELTVWSPEGVLDTRENAPEESAGGGRCCCVCKCCQSGRVPAFLSVLASFLCASAILYALHSYVHVQLPDCPDVTSRVVFTLCCCAVATVPVVLAMLLGAMCRFCSASFSLHDSPPRRHAIQQLFVTASLQLLFLYVLNLLVMAAFIPQQQLKLVPMLVAMFILGRLVYWASLNACSSWRGFGSGLTIFPLMALLVYNLFLLYNLYRRRESLLPSQDIFFNQVTTSSWLGETTQSPSGTPDVLATNFPNSQ